MSGAAIECVLNLHFLCFQVLQTVRTGQAAQEGGILVSVIMSSGCVGGEGGGGGRGGGWVIGSCGECDVMEGDGRGAEQSTA